LKEGAVVPRHSHENEQVSQVIEGRLRFNFDGQSIEAGPGGIVQISPHEAHEVVALENSIALDIFQPVREDWLRGEDAYLRNPSG
jgi:quercetin dioxygenase-like cupin family protein